MKKNTDDYEFNFDSDEKKDPEPTPNTGTDFFEQEPKTQPQMNNKYHLDIITEDPREMESRMGSRISLKEGKRDPLTGSNPPVKTGNGFLGHPGDAKFNDFESYYDGNTVQDGASIVDSQAQTGEHSSHEVDYERFDY